MSFLFYATNLLLLISFVVFVRQVAEAPEGHEDAAGFHFEGKTAGHNSRRTSTGRRAKSVPAYAKVSARHVAA